MKWWVVSENRNSQVGRRLILLEAQKKRIYSPLGANILVGEKKVEIELKARVTH